MASQVDICNVALARIGQAPIAAMNEASTEAQFATRFWSIALRDTLRAHPWNFAVTTAELAAVTAKPGWTYAYQLPADCLRALALVSDTANDPDAIRYEIRGKALLSNQETAVLKYIAFVPDTTKYDDAFVSALAYRLAAELAVPITGKVDRAQMMLRLWAAGVKSAQQADAQEARQFDPAGQSILSARF